MINTIEEEAMNEAKELGRPPLFVYQSEEKEKVATPEKPKKEDLSPNGSKAPAIDSHRRDTTPDKGTGPQQVSP